LTSHLSLAKVKRHGHQHSLPQENQMSAGNEADIRSVFHQHLPFFGS
jgi:hypothetical protein